MKTQVSILVKNESLFSRFFSLLWFINIFKKMSVQVTIDNDQVNAKELQASKEPYLIDVTPGSHEFLFTDCRAAGKAAYWKSLGCMFSLILNIASGGWMFDSDDFSGSGVTVKDGCLSCTLNEGDLLRISVKPKYNGTVKIKILK